MSYIGCGGFLRKSGPEVQKYSDEKDFMKDIAANLSRYEQIKMVAEE